MKITLEEQRQRKQRIVESAFALFCKKGIEKVSVLDIAHHAQVGESTIYRYFTNKPQLVLHTLSVLWGSITVGLEEKVEQTEDYAKMSGCEQIAVHLECCRQLFLDNADYVLFSYEAKLYLQRNHVQISGEQYDALMKAFKEPCIAAFEKGKRDGSIPVMENSTDLFYAVWGAIRGFIVKIVIYEALCKDENPWKQRYGILVEGLLSALRNGWKPVGI